MAKSAIIKVVALADVARLVGGMKKAGQSVKGFESSGSASMKKFSAVAAGAAGAAALIGAALIQATKAAIEDSKGQVLLAKSMQNVLGSTKGQIAESEKFIAGLQRTTNILDDQLRPAYSTLIRSTGDATQSQALLTLATDISAATGKDLSSVSLALGKAYNGQLTSLNKLIPGISKAKDPMAELQKQFKGSAEAAANLDPMKKMEVMFGDLSETVGAVLIPVMNTLLDAIQPLIDTLAPIITDLVSKLAPILIAIIEPLAGFLGQLMKDLAPVIAVILDLVNVLMTLLAPILDVVSMVIGEVAKAVMALIEPLMPLIKKIMPIFAMIIGQVTKNLGPLMKIINLLAGILGKVLGKAFEDLMPILDIVTVALTAIFDVLNGIIDGVEKSIEWLGALLGIDLKTPMASGGLTGEQTSIMAQEKAGFYGYGPMALTPKMPGGGGGGKKGPSAADKAREALKGAIKTLQGKLQEAQKLVQSTVEAFRNSVDTAFGLVQRGSSMVFRADRYIRELKRMRNATADFNSNLQKLRDMGGKAANPLLEQILSKSPEEAAAIMRSFTASPEMFAEAIKTTSELAATGGMVGKQLNSMAGNQTQAEMLNEIKLLRGDLASGKNTYNVKATMSAIEIVNQIKAWEKSTGKKVLVG